MTNTRICDSPDCTRTTVKSHIRWCSGHRARLYKQKHLGIGVPFRVWPNKPNPPTGCVTAGCPEQALLESLYCAAHDTVSPRPTLCEIEGCENDLWYSRLCPQHYRRWQARGHNRSRYRTREGECAGRCAVCRWDHANEARENRRTALEQGPLHAQARREIVERVWAGEPLEEAAAAAGLTVQQLWSTGVAWPEFVYALDAGLMARRDPGIPHGIVYSYRERGCRCPQCRGAKARAR